MSTAGGSSARSSAGSPARSLPRGGFGVGLVVGLLIGLGVALGVALYITKAPVPFVDKLPQRTAAQDAAEAERNKNWDPNAPLAGKTPARPASASAATQTQAPTAVHTPAPAPAPATAPAPAQTSAQAPAAAPAKPAASAVTARDAAALLGSNPAARPAAPPASAAAAQFYVQAGAYSTADDAEAQRARLALQGHQAKVMAREQSGRTVYRVRLGPFDSREGADDLRDKLGAAGVESTLVRVER